MTDSGSARTADAATPAATSPAAAPDAVVGHPRVKATDGVGGDGALVLFSGGQDSATCLAWALDRFERVETIGFDYGQRHRVELACRRTLREHLFAPSAWPDIDGKPREPARQPEDRAQSADTARYAQWSSRLGEDHLIDLSLLAQISDTAMTQEIEIAMREDGLPNTFVPGRNLLFLTVAATIAYRRGLRVLVGGMCETDFSGYPDCRDDTLKALQVALNLGMDRRMILQTPLMWLDKAATWQLAAQLGGAPFVDLIREHTHTCYLGDRTHRHAWGYGCGTCPACALRANGYQAFVARSEQS